MFFKVFNSVGNVLFTVPGCQQTDCGGVHNRPGTKEKPLLMPVKVNIAKIVIFADKPCML